MLARAFVQFASPFVVFAIRIPRPFDPVLTFTFMRVMAHY